MNETDLSRLRWYKSSFSTANSQCCTCARLRDSGMALMDSKNPDGAVLSFSRGQWQAFISGVALEEFN
jgi:Domain of unknown function (DUF397)